MKKIIYRKATLNDQELLLELEQKIIEAERPYNSTIKEHGAVYYDLNSLLSATNSYLVVAEMDGLIIGTGYAQLRSSKKSLKHEFHSYLGFMYVDPQCRGQGINKQLIEMLVEWSKGQGVTDFYLEVYDGNDSAIRAYEKAGFAKSLVEMKLNLSH